MVFPNFTVSIATTINQTTDWHTVDFGIQCMTATLVVSSIFGQKRAAVSTAFGEGYKMVQTCYVFRNSDLIGVSLCPE